MQGQRLSLGKEGIDYLPAGTERVKVLDTKQILLGVASISAEGLLQPERLVSVREFSC
jgi:hypothetical protein